MTVLADRFDGKRLNGRTMSWSRTTMQSGSAIRTTAVTPTTRAASIDPELPPYSVPAGPGGHAAQSPPKISPARTDCVSRRTGAAFMWLKAGCSLPKMQLGTSELFDVVDGKLHDGRMFHVISPGFADGIRCDTDGRIWSSAADGVHCLDPDGTLIGKILTGVTFPTYFWRPQPLPPVHLRLPPADGCLYACPGEPKCHDASHSANTAHRIDSGRPAPL